MKDNKLVEKYDDNPGAYFDMLIEEDNLKKYRVYYINLDDRAASEDVYAKDEDDAREVFKKKKIKYKRITGVRLLESLQEDKFVPRDKMSKKDRKELDSQKRNTWGNTNPVTRVQPNKKAYDRKRDKKIEDESLKENFNIELKDYKKDEDVQNGYTFNFIVNGHLVTMNCWNDGWNSDDGDLLVDFDNYSQVLDFLSQEEAEELWEKLGDIIESKISKNESLEESKLNESSDGWNEDKLYDIKYILDKLENLNYEINNCVRGAYSYCKTYEELGHYISDLGEKLADLGSDVSLIDEEEDDEFED